jgi:dihydrofolate reductase
MAQAGDSIANGGALLLGRRTYEGFYAVWPKRKDSPFSALLDTMQKYVASRTLAEPLLWRNSTLLSGDAAQTVARLVERLHTKVGGLSSCAAAGSSGCAPWLKPATSLLLRELTHPASAG